MVPEQPPLFDVEPEPDLADRKQAAKVALADYAEQLESEKTERAESGKRRRSDAEEKSIELLLEGAVSIVVEGGLAAEVVGDTDTHHVSWSEIDDWWCSCPSSMFRRKCSHIAAVRRVVRLVTSEKPT